MGKKLVFIIVFLSLTLSTAAAVEGTFIAVRGEVEIKKTGESDFSAAAAGHSVPAGTVICTGFNSTAEIDVVSGLLRVGPLSRITIEQLVINGQTAQTGISLDSGSLNASVDSSRWSDNNFQVRTPVTTASVRGTEFFITPRTLECSEGRVAFSSEDGRTAITSAGQNAVAAGRTLRGPRGSKEFNLRATAGSPLSIAYDPAGSPAAAGSSSANQRDNRFLRQQAAGRIGGLTITIE